MKTFNTIFAVIAATLLFAGCVNEEPNYNKDNGPDGPQNTGTGYLQLRDMSLNVIFDDKTETHPDDTENETQRPDSRSITRATQDIDTFIVEIFNAENTSVLKKSYGELKSELAEKSLELPVGSYRMEVCSEETLADVAWEKPFYKGVQSFSLLKGQTTTIKDVVCTLANIKVTLMCSADLAARLNTAPAVTKATVSLGAIKTDFSIGETRAVYFRAPELLNTLNFVLDGQFTDGGKVKFTSVIDKVKAGQWRKISLVITYADKGTVGIDIKVDNFILDEEIHIDGSGSWREELLPEEPVIDPSAPTITWPGHSLTEPIELNDSMFDADGNCTASFALALASTNTLQNFVVSFGSTNPALITDLKEKLGTDAAIDLCGLTQTAQAYVWFRLFGFPVGSTLTGATAKNFDLSGMMPTLYEVEGIHTVTITLTDALGLSTTTTLTIKVQKTTAPVVEWIGYDISQPQTLADGMTARVEITAGAGIKSLLVTIDSPALAVMINAIGFAALLEPFDLCTIDQENPDAADFLKTVVGFRVGSDVKGQTFTFFDITDFVPVLKNDIPPTVPGTPNVYKFHLEVIDNTGKTTKAVLHLVQPEATAK